MSFDVVGVGIACLDLNATVTSIPRVDENVLMLDFRKQMGGTVSTALATLQRLGMRTKYLGMLGDDENGRFTLEGLRAEGVDVSSVRIAKDQSSPFSFVMVDSMTGRRSIAYFPGCSFTVPADCIEPEAIRSARLLHVDIATPAVFAACATAARAAVPISIEANAPYPGLEDLLTTGNIFISSRDIICGLAERQDPLEAGKKLLEEYALDLVVVTLGEEGSLAVTTTQTARSPGFKVTVIDTTGAGDVFHGAYIYGHLKGWGLEKTLRFANAAGAIMCTTQTGWAGIPTLPQVEAFLHDRAGELKQA
ncbi:MAG: sugar kinase [Candidatus Abyssubacteria bacterium]